MGCFKCLLGCFTPMGIPEGSYEKQDGAAPDYAQEKWWDCYGEDKGPSAMVPSGEGVHDKLPVDQRPADVFYLHPTCYVGATWQMPASDLRAGEWAAVNMSLNASAFNGTCRIFAPRYRQATLFSYLDVTNGRAAFDGAYEDVRAAFQHYLAFQNQGRPFLIASHSQGGWHALRLLQEFVEAKPLAEKFVAAYCLGSWLPEAMFLGKGAAFKQVATSSKWPSSGSVYLRSKVEGFVQRSQHVNLRVVCSPSEAELGDREAALCITPPTRPQIPNPQSCTLHPTPYTLHPTPYTLHPTPCTPHPTP